MINNIVKISLDISGARSGDSYLLMKKSLKSNPSVHMFYNMISVMRYIYYFIKKQITDKYDLWNSQAERKEILFYA